MKLEISGLSLGKATIGINPKTKVWMLHIHFSGSSLVHSNSFKYLSIETHGFLMFFGIPHFKNLPIYQLKYPMKSGTKAFDLELQSPRPWDGEFFTAMTVPWTLVIWGNQEKV